ncbi:PAB1 binding protein [Malassezia vespertilionis]|uniref:K Homology domain-containing protein n=1 Tax=Malassezia vespertilionis TaxID=2020962 RepID=A0A2N1JCP2_9BASI|nr:PAB1 binding protein [Malassezia vespertilionis]PKI84304.1 hypothetical protein MVES_001450 [Malassezia vespertilionis]WFD06197.1 PAB1 binding protein [Malassezia vespertilionis]
MSASAGSDHAAGAACVSELHSPVGHDNGETNLPTAFNVPSMSHVDATVAQALVQEAHRAQTMAGFPTDAALSAATNAPQPVVPLQPSYTQTVPAPIVLRVLIITSDASVIIGKQGRHINEIRELSNARLNISESVPMSPERILTVSGPLDAVSKVFGLIVRRMTDEPYDEPSVPGMRIVTIRLIIPNSRMGSIIGKQGNKIKEIQEASGAALNAGETMLPGSTERVLSITGVADSIHIAVFYVGTILLEHPDRNANNLAYRPSAAPTARSMSTAPFNPTTAPMSSAQPASAYRYGGTASPNPLPSTLAPGSQTQQIFIPNDLVGCIIGKGGQKINEIRQLSASHIKIMDRGAGTAAGGTGSERLVTITGPPPNIQMAVTLLYQRLEQEKLRLSQNASGGI